MYHTRNDGSIYLSYTKDERLQVLNMSLTEIATNLGFTPVQKGNHYSLKEMDSLMIYNDHTWYRFSGKGRINGGSTIDFMLEFGNAENVPEAVQKLLEMDCRDVRQVSYVQSSNSVNSDNKGKEQHEFKLPPKNDNYRRLYAYLMQTRGLSQEVVSDFVHRHLIYEEAEHHNIVFCGYDPEGVVRYAGMRGTADIYGKKFKCDVAGNDKNYGVNIVNKDSGILLVFESVIDCMSYIDFYGDKETNKLILGMVEDNPLEQFLKDYSHIYNIKFCLDNDEAGHIALNGRTDLDGNVIKKGLIEKYKEKGYDVDVLVPLVGKDWNEMLLAINKEKPNITFSNQPFKSRR